MEDVSYLEPLFVAEADGVVSIISERRDPLKAFPFVQADGGVLMNASLEPEQVDAMSARMRGQVVEHQLAVPLAAKLRSHPHALDLAVLAAEQLDAAAAGGRAAFANDEERDRVGNQLLNAEPMPALARIERRQMCVELRDQRRGVRAGGMLRRYRSRNVVSPDGNASNYVRLGAAATGAAGRRRTRRLASLPRLSIRAMISWPT